MPESKKDDAPKGEPAKDTVDVKSGVAQTDANKEAAQGKEAAAPNATPVKNGTPEGLKNDEPPAPSKADLKRAELADELERLKVEGNAKPERLAELKKLLAEAPK